jgi:uncharacterized iron-regulated protein
LPGRPTDRGGSTLHESAGRFVLGRPLDDFYDTAFVLTDGGTIPPRVVTVAELADVLVRYDVVVFGELHDHSAVHVEQSRLLRALYAKDPHWILSMEQFERDVQGVVDEYLAGRIGETPLMDQGRAWKNYAASYRPLVLFAEQHHLPVIAAEAPDWTITCVGRYGPAILDRFSPLERSWVAQNLHLTPGPYRDKFLQFMGGSAAHGGGPPSDAQARTERSFAAQVARDDTMAESIVRALQRHRGYKVLHLTGSFHAAGFLGTVERLRLLDPDLKIAVIDPVEVDDPRAPAFTADDTRQGTALQLVYPTPDPFVQGEDTSAWLAKMARDRETHRCPYELPPAESR